MPTQSQCRIRVRRNDHPDRTHQPPALRLVEDPTRCAWCGLRIAKNTHDGIQRAFACFFWPKLVDGRLEQAVHIGPVHDALERPCRDRYIAWLKEQA